jgi:hypothetical protein
VQPVPVLDYHLPLLERTQFPKSDINLAQSAMSTFKHTPFDLERPGIRLLRLLKGEDPLIHCELFQTWHDGDDTDSIPYEALSYTWGGVEMAASVHIGSGTYNVTENLYLALHHLRYQHEDRILWVDAICIDQSNNQERGHQVNQMRDIYSKADRVLIWLGPATDDVDTLMDSLKELEKRSRRNWAIHDKRWTENWSSLQLESQTGHWDIANRQLRGLKSLLERAWFKRVWILQEVANGSKSTVCSGTKSVSARVFAIAPLLLNLRPKPHCQAVLDIMPGWSRENSWWSTKRDLRALLYKFRASEASDPRDKIYALLGMCSDCNDPRGLRADYTKALPQVVHDATVFMFYGNDQCCTVADLVNKIIIDNIRSLKTIVATESVAWVSEILKLHSKGTINADVIEAAAGNVRYGEEMMSYLLGSLKGNTLITDHVLTAAEMNLECGKGVLGVLLEKRGEQLVGIAAGRDHAKIVAWLLQQREVVIELTENVVYHAATNPTHGWKTLCIFLEQPTSRVEIKDGAFDMGKFVTRRLAKSLEGRIRRVKKTGEVIWNDSIVNRDCDEQKEEYMRNRSHAFSGPEHELKRFIEEARVMRRRQPFRHFCWEWISELQSKQLLDLDWRPQFDKSWEPWQNEISDSLRHRETIQSKAHLIEEWTCYCSLSEFEELEIMYNGWKRVSRLFRSRCAKREHDFSE